MYAMNVCHELFDHCTHPHLIFIRRLVLLQLYPQVHPQALAHPLLERTCLLLNLLLRHLKYATRTLEESRFKQQQVTTFKSLNSRYSRLALTLLKERQLHGHPLTEHLELIGLWMDSLVCFRILRIQAQVLGSR
jgi:hypothetical protein